MTMQKLIGKEVTLTLKNLSPMRTIDPTQPDTYTLVGTVMKRGHWEKDSDVFGFAVPFTDVPLRQIHIRLVTAINGIPMVHAEEKTPEEVHQIKASRGDEYYTVRRVGSFWSCTCVANSSFRKICRHIKEAKGE